MEKVGRRAYLFAFLFIAIQGQGDPLRTMISQENVLIKTGKGKDGKRTSLCVCLLGIG